MQVEYYELSPPQIWRKYLRCKEDILAPSILDGFWKALKFIIKYFEGHISTEDLNIIIRNNTEKLLTEDISSVSTSSISSKDEEAKLKLDPNIIAKTEMKETKLNPSRENLWEASD